MRWSNSVALLVTLCAVLSCGPIGAVAQYNRSIDAAHQHAEQADFEAALEAFERAEREGGLSRQDLVELLTRRPIIYHALRDEPRMQRDLACLAALEPGFEFGVEVVPQVRSAFVALREQVEPLRLELRLRQQGQQLEISTEYGRLPPQLLLGDKVHARVAGRSWQTAARRLSISNPKREPVEYFAEAFGPGGALLIARGSEQAPLRFDYPPPVAARQDGPSLLPFVLGGGAVLLAGATILLIALVAESDDTQFQGPIIR